MPTFLLNIDRQQSVLGSTSFHSRAYSPYGALSTAVGPELGFCGQHRDRLTQNYPLGNGYRFYSPTMMRFYSPDSISPFGAGGLNAYAYCLGDPVNHRDPGGQEAEDYLFPLLSILINLQGLVISGLSFRSYHKRGVAFRRATEAFSAESEVTRASTLEKVNSSISAVSSVAGSVLGIHRLAEPGEEWHDRAILSLTSISLVTSGIEIWRLSRAKPWKAQTPVTLVNNVQMRELPESGASIRSGSV